MNTYHAPELIEFFVSIGFLIWLFYGLWSDFVVDLVRQNLFEIRDSVFTLAAEGKLNFEDKAYLVFRERTNHMIRFCHHFSLWNLIASELASDINQRKQIDKTEVLELIRAIPDPDVARQLERKYIEATLLLMASMVLRSLGLLMAITILLLPLAIYEMLKGYKASEKLFKKVNSAVERDLACDSSSST